jgi:hypothetical protein
MPPLSALIDPSLARERPSWPGLATVQGSCRVNAIPRRVVKHMKITFDSY